MEKQDLLLWSAVLLLVGVGIVGFHYFEAQSALLRVVVLLLLGGIAAFLASRTVKGQAALTFAQAAHVEVRKVVWPSRKETVQTTLIVVAMVILLALIIWVVDSLLFWIVKLLTS